MRALLSTVFGLLVVGALAAGVIGCKSYDAAKAESCKQTAGAEMDDCKKCCAEAGAAGHMWSTDSCKCMK